jgi:ADP-ribose pyrophosphatase YjhB (NUDIX family)
VSDRSEQQYLSNYQQERYPTPLFSVDVALFTLHQGQLKVLLVKRAAFPYQSCWALPGGFVDLQEDANIDITAKRKLLSKTGIEAPWLEQVITVGNDQRDPRGWSVTTLYMALIPYAPTAEFIDSVSDAEWFSWQEVASMTLAFDHQHLLELARERLKYKTAYTLLPLHVLQAPFSLTQLQSAFELLMEKSLEKKSFRRRISNAGVLQEVGEGVPEGGRGRPTALYMPVPGNEQHQFLRAYD